MNLTATEQLRYDLQCGHSTHSITVSMRQHQALLDDYQLKLTELLTANKVLRRQVIFVTAKVKEQQKATVKQNKVSSKLFQIDSNQLNRQREQKISQLTSQLKQSKLIISRLQTQLQQAALKQSYLTLGDKELKTCRQELQQLTIKSAQAERLAQLRRKEAAALAAEHSQLIDRVQAQKMKFSAQLKQLQEQLESKTKQLQTVGRRADSLAQQCKQKSQQAIQLFEDNRVKGQQLALATEQLSRLQANQARLNYGMQAQLQISRIQLQLGRREQELNSERHKNQQLLSELGELRKQSQYYKRKLDKVTAELNASQARGKTLESQAERLQLYLSQGQKQGTEQQISKSVFKRRGGPSRTTVLQARTLIQSAIQRESFERMDYFLDYNQEQQLRKAVFVFCKMLGEDSAVVALGSVLRFLQCFVGMVDQLSSVPQERELTFLESVRVKWRRLKEIVKTRVLGDLQQQK